ncbi:MAG TPA: hypothetical protein PLL64_00285 [Rhodothermales bacterium]|nr:hypothetical protein [Rhodothermales bacterium]HRR07087.1 hypothetical protein [Rhodothermales bacterium]
MANTVLTDTDLQRVRTAVQQAEARTSGEIVPFIVKKSDVYASAAWRAGAFGMLLGGLIGFGLSQFNNTWGLGWLYTNWGVVLLMLLFAAGFFALAQFQPGMKRFFAGYLALNKRVQQRAVQAFLTEEVFNTEDRTGILLFISLMEHRILVMGDSGINAKVQQEDWEQVVARIKRGIKQNSLADGLVEAIQMCGDLLERKEVKIKPNDRNELSDDLRIQDH